MSELTLHGPISSFCSRRVLIVAKELGIDLKVVTVDVAGAEHKSEGYVTSKQPFGQFPVLEPIGPLDGEFQLFESRAICRYLAAKYNSKLLPNVKEDIKGYARFEEAASIEAFNWDPYAHQIIMERVVNPHFGKDPDESIVAKARETLEKKLEGYESKNKYLRGDELTLADLFHLSYGHVVQLALNNELFVNHPNVSRWWNEISNRPSWKAVLALTVAE